MLKGRLKLFRRPFCWFGLHLDFIGREGFPFVAGGAVPEEDLGFEVAVAAAVHDAALELAADDGAHHVGVGFPRGIHVADFQTQQAVHAVEVGFLAHEFDGKLGRFAFAFEQQGFFVDDVDKV